MADKPVNNKPINNQPVANGPMRVTPTGAVRVAPNSAAAAASWKIVPSAETLVKGSTQEMYLDVDALDRYEEFTSDMHNILLKYEAAMPHIPPMATRITILRPIDHIVPISPLIIPSSTIFDISVGWLRSTNTSPSIIKGERSAKNQYFFRYLNIFTFSS